MVISAREALRSMEKAISGARHEEDRITEMLRSAVDDAARLRQEKAEALKALARIRLEHIAADETLGRLDSAERRALEALERHSLTVSDAAIAVNEARDELARAEEARNVAAMAAEAAVAAVDALVDETYARMIDNPEWTRQTEVLQAAEARAAAADEKAAQAEADREEKRKPYEADPLFMYLWNRSYKSSDYKATGLVRMLDDWVAGLVRYADARANYAMLTEIPVRLRAHADDLAQRAQIERARLEEMEADRIRTLAGGDLFAELRAARDRQDSHNKELEAVTSELRETGNQLHVYAKGEDQSFKSAVGAYAKFLEQENIVRLMSEAYRTATSEDDRIVDSVKRLKRDLEDIEKDNAERRRRLDRLASRKQELERVSANFRRRRYDDVGSEFDDDLDLDDWLEMLMRGAISAAEYWARTRSKQRWRQRPGDPWRRQSGLPPFGGWPGGLGGSWGGGGSRSGGSRRGGGDFETGGGF